MGRLDLLNRMKHIRQPLNPFIPLNDNDLITSLAFTSPPLQLNFIYKFHKFKPLQAKQSNLLIINRLLWEDSEFRPEWIKDLDTVVADGGGDEIENPLFFLGDSSMVEPLGGCGKNVMMWWLHAEARADSEFPARWTIDPQLVVAVAAKRTPWPDVPPELQSNTEKVITGIHSRKQPEKCNTDKNSKIKTQFHEARENTN